MGVLPPITRLTPEMASYHFLSGFTAKVAGTEEGVKEPSPTFSTCFGAPFMPRDPVLYAEMLAAAAARRADALLARQHRLVGRPLRAGKRMSISLTRSLLKAALEGELDDVHTTPHPVLGVLVPEHCPKVPSRLLDPRATWPDPAAYDERAAELAERFRANFAGFAGRVSPGVAAAGPRAAP